MRKWLTSMSVAFESYTAGETEQQPNLDEYHYTKQLHRFPHLEDEHEALKIQLDAFNEKKEQENKRKEAAQRRLQQSTSVQEHPYPMTRSSQSPPVSNNPPQPDRQPQGQLRGQLISNNPQLTARGPPGLPAQRHLQPITTGQLSQTEPLAKMNEKDARNAEAQNRPGPTMVTIVRDQKGREITREVHNDEMAPASTQAGPPSTQPAQQPGPALPTHLAASPAQSSNPNTTKPAKKTLKAKETSRPPIDVAALEDKDDD
ncbi:hypothetical protein P154DRAFT_616807 [Amniculicola lignicola CBS 123094]|uniref:Uncharacterized protein n=1 Tax=Amniculicola lignicola CBS 123094 TaxID=1392246 RepID=A0A6A5X1Z1_9PLEO|nr:hypothetical protein P154DRAFT_616807 [Amniculicola lignicola CBS 123094]